MANALRMFSPRQIGGCVDAGTRDSHCGACGQQGDDVEDSPFVCPGCLAVGGEQCEPVCIDAEMAQASEKEDGPESEGDDDPS